MTNQSLPRSFLPKQNVKSQNQLLFPFHCYNIRGIRGWEVNIHFILVLKLDADDILCPHHHWGGRVRRYLLDSRHFLDVAWTQNIQILIVPLLSDCAVHSGNAKCILLYRLVQCDVTYSGKT